MAAASGPVLGLVKEDLIDGALGCSPVPGKVVRTGLEGTWLMGDTADEGDVADGAALLMGEHCWHGGTQLMMGGHGLTGGHH